MCSSEGSHSSSDDETSTDGQNWRGFYIGNRSTWWSALTGEVLHGGLWLLSSAPSMWLWSHPSTYQTPFESHSQPYPLGSIFKPTWWTECCDTTWSCFDQTEIDRGWSKGRWRIMCTNWIQLNWNPLRIGRRPRLKTKENKKKKGRYLGSNNLIKSVLLHYSSFTLGAILVDNMLS